MAQCLRHYNFTIGTTAGSLQLPPNVFSVLFRAAAANTGTIYVTIDELPANATYGMPLTASESISLDLSQAIQENSRMGSLTQDRFIRQIGYIASAAGQVLNIEVLAWV